MVFGNGGPAPDPDDGDPTFDPSTGQYSTDPSAGLLSIDPLAGGFSADPTGGLQSVDPLVGGYSSSPYVPGYSSDPNSDLQSVDPLVGGYSVSPYVPGFSSGPNNAPQSADPLVGGYSSNPYATTPGPAPPEAGSQAVLRAPDYVTMDVNYSIPLLFAPVLGAIPFLSIDFGGTVTLTRYGQIFLGGEVGPTSPGFGSSIQAGWIDQSATPGPEQLQGFISSWSVSAGGMPVAFPLGNLAVGPAVTEVWGNPGQLTWSAFATQIGVAVGGGEGYALLGSWSNKNPWIWKALSW